MNIELGDIRVRDFERKDADNLYRIVREKHNVRHMEDWSREIVSDNNYYELVDLMEAQKGKTDFLKRKAYSCLAIALADTDEQIGMVAVSYKKELFEIEVAYFMSEKYLQCGYTSKALNALVKWCFETFDEKEIPYLILTANCANIPSNKLAAKCGFKLFERRIPFDAQGNELTKDTYNYYRKFR